MAMKWNVEFSKTFNDKVEANNYYDAIALAVSNHADSILENVCPDIDDVQKTFITDSEKMRDFLKMSKEDFLNFYSYLSEDEYDITDAYCAWLFEHKTEPTRKINKVYGYIAVNTEGWYWGNSINGKHYICSEGFAHIYYSMEDCIQAAYDSYRMHWKDELGGECELDENENSICTYQQFRQAMMNGENCCIQMPDYHIEYCMFSEEIK